MIIPPFFFSLEYILYLVLQEGLLRRQDILVTMGRGRKVGGERERGRGGQRGRKLSPSPYTHSSVSPLGHISLFPSHTDTKQFYESKAIYLTSRLLAQSLWRSMVAHRTSVFFTSHPLMGIQAGLDYTRRYLRSSPRTHSLSLLGEEQRSKTRERR